MSALECRDVRVTVDRTTIVRSVSFQIEEGEVVVIVGPNGAGKSTLLGAVAGTLPLADGTISIFGSRLSSWTEVSLARRRAMITQSSSLNLPFVVEDVVALGRAPFDDEDPTIVRDSLAAVSMLPYARRIYPSLSGGERQRVHFARAIAQLGGPSARGPRLLLLDEPTSALDLEHQHRCLSAIRALASNGVAVLAVLHALDLAARYADRVLVMDRGELVTSGAPREVLAPSILKDVFRVDGELVTVGAGHTALVVHQPLGDR